MVTSLVRRDDAFTDEEIVAWLRRRIGDGLLDVVDEFETLTIVLDTAVWVEAARLLKEEPRLAFTMFDCLFGVDQREDGFDVVAILYSVETGRRVLLRCRADGGRDEPVVPTLTDVFRGANFHERETWDMFGIDFAGHVSLTPRILSVENFEGWPLRKDFHLATREAKPWPGIKEPAETDEDGNVVVKPVGIGEAVGPMPLDEIMAEQARAANPELVAAQEDDRTEDGDVLADDHTDHAQHGAGSGGTAELEAEVLDGGEMPGVSDPDELRAQAAAHRADRAREIAADGLVTGAGDGEEIPAGNPDAFEVHGSTPAKEQVGADTRSRDEIDVDAAVASGRIDDEPDTDPLNDPATSSMSAGVTTDDEKQGHVLRDAQGDDDGDSNVATGQAAVADAATPGRSHEQGDEADGDEPGDEADGARSDGEAERSDP